jgi:hypothetical protein
MARYSNAELQRLITQILELTPKVDKLSVKAILESALEEGNERIILDKAEKARVPLPQPKPEGPVGTGATTRDFEYQPGSPFGPEGIFRERVPSVSTLGDVASAGKEAFTGALGVAGGLAGAGAGLIPDVLKRPLAQTAREKIEGVLEGPPSLQGGERVALTPEQKGAFERGYSPEEQAAGLGAAAAAPGERQEGRRLTPDAIMAALDQNADAMAEIDYQLSLNPSDTKAKLLNAQMTELERRREGLIDELTIAYDIQDREREKDGGGAGGLTEYQRLSEERLGRQHTESLAQRREEERNRVLERLATLNNEIQQMRLSAAGSSIPPGVTHVPGTEAGGFLGSNPYHRGGPVPVVGTNWTPPPPYTAGQLTGGA